MNDFPQRVPAQRMDEGDANADTIHNAQTPAEGGQPADVIAQINDLKAQLGQLSERNKWLEGRIQSQDDRLAAKLHKGMKDNEESYRRVARQEGWDDATLDAKIRDANKELLTSLSVKDLEEIVGGTAQAQPNAAPAQAVSPQYDAQTAYGQHAQALQQFLAQRGLSPADLGPQGITPYVMAPTGSEAEYAFYDAVNKAARQKRALAAQAALHVQRQGLADEMAEELEAYGGIGATSVQTGNGASGASARAKLEEKAIQEFRNTGRVADALAAKRKIQQRFG